MPKNTNTTRITLEEAKKLKGRSNLARLLSEQRNEVKKKPASKWLEECA